MKAFFTLLGTGRLVAFGEKCLPFFHLNLGWILPALLGLTLGLLLRKFKGQKSGC